jgi:hypothetical protein
MVAGGLEPVLVSNPSDGYNGSFRIGEWESTAGNSPASVTDLLLAAALIDDDTVPSFKAAK